MQCLHLQCFQILHLPNHPRLFLLHTFFAVVACRIFSFEEELFTWRFVISIFPVKSIKDGFLFLYLDIELYLVYKVYIWHTILLYTYMYNKLLIESSGQLYFFIQIKIKLSIINTFLMSILPWCVYYPLSFSDVFILEKTSKSLSESTCNIAGWPNSATYY